MHGAEGDSSFHNSLIMLGFVSWIVKIRDGHDNFKNVLGLVWFGLQAPPQAESA